MGRQGDLYEQASRVLVAGASAGQRYNAQLGHPLYLSRAEGSRLYDVDGTEYIDFHGGSGAALFGHGHPRIKAALLRAIERGFFMNYDCEETVELARLVQQVFPGCEKIRLANTGSEATQAAIRLARAHTGRNLVLRFDGHFHGMHESIWFNHNALHPVDGHGEVATVPDSAGFPAEAAASVVTVVFNDVEALEHAVRRYAGRIAAVIVEPVSYNCGCLEAREHYLAAVREICTREEIVLIFDEVITGLRLSPGSAQRRFGVTPDLTTAAKAIGGGLPIALVGGRAEIMDRFNPLGDVVMSGTYTGALLPVAATVECLRMSLEPGFYKHFDTLGARLFGGVEELMAEHHVRGHVRGLGARWAIYFGVDDPEDDFDFRRVAEQFDRETDQRFVRAATAAGLWFHDTSIAVTPAHRALMTAHTMGDVEETLDRLDGVFAALG